MKIDPGTKNIAVIGGGNIGTQFACICASKGHKVNLLSSKPELFDGTLEVVDEAGYVTRGKLNKVSSKVQTVIDGCQIIFVTHPAFRLKEVSDSIEPYINDGMKIVIIPGTGAMPFS